MPKPVVLAAFAPEEPEEANAFQKVLAAKATIRWLPELGLSVSPAELADVAAMAFFHWPKALDPHLPAMTKLRFLQRIPAGVESLPFDRLAPLKDRVQVAGGSGSNATWVAEHAMALLLTAAKRVAFHDREMRKGAFHQFRPLSKELSGATLGIIGYGAIGQRFAKLASGFGMKVRAIRRHPARKAGSVRIGGPETLDRLLAESDYVLVAVPLTNETRGMIGRPQLQRMRTGAVLVNIARAPIVDAEALYHHLTLHPDFTAALDVWWERTLPGEPFRPRLPFHELPNVVMTPHNAAVVPSFRTRMVEFAAQNIRTALSGRRPKNVVRFEDYL